MDFFGSGWSTLDLLFMPFLVLLQGAMIVGALTLGIRWIDPDDHWLRSRGVALDVERHPSVRYFGLLNRLLRVIGATAGMLLGSAFDAAFMVDTSAGAGFWAWVTAGWMVGAWWADRSVTLLGEWGAAEVIRRDTQLYLPAGLLVAPAVAAATTVGISALGAMAGSSGRSSNLGEPLTDPARFGAAAIALIFVLLIHVLQRSVIRRPQPLMTQHLREIDDAARSWTVHNIGGAGTAAIFCIATRLLELEMLVRDRLPFGFRGWLPLVPAIAGYVAWRYWSFRPFRVRRPEGAVP